ncbi:MAG: STAS domain-containing protein [Clostridiales bacterium]|jgi:anti-anti-sigma factor|nr:STAS domain-containing protein [Clostridiales bacterium]
MENVKKFNINIEVIQKNLTAKFSGEIGCLESVEIHKRLEEEFSDKKSSEIRNITFDMEKVNFIDSSMIGVIFWIYKELKIFGGRLLIINTQKQVDKILETTGVKNLLK